MEYILRRSERKTISVQVTDELAVLVRAPNRLSQGQIDAFVRAHEAWIQRRIERIRAHRARYPEPDAQELARLQALARAQLPARVAHYSRIMGLTAESVRITLAAKRFGSCTGSRLCFSARLMRYPQEAVDYVVVHELAHIRHKNHGREFYACIEKVLPDYRERIKLLKE